jgi:hypothetical protein
MSNFQKITVESIYDAREGNNKDYKTLRLQTLVERTNTASGVLSAFLGSKFDNMSKVNAFQSIHVDILDEHGIQVGSVLQDEKGASMIGANIRLTVTELTTPEFNRLSDEDKLSYQIKRNSKEDELILVKDGLPVWRRVAVSEIDATDKFVSHDAKVASDAFDQDEMREGSVVSAEADTLKA